MTALARRDDPWTSWAAALSVTGLREKQAAVLHCMIQRGPCSLSQLVAAYAEAEPGFYPMQTDQGVRSRCAELADRGLVFNTGASRRNDVTGRPERILAATLARRAPAQVVTASRCPSGDVCERDCARKRRGICWCADNEQQEQSPMTIDEPEGLF